MKQKQDIKDQIFSELKPSILLITSNSHTTQLQTFHVYIFSYRMFKKLCNLVFLLLHNLHSEVAVPFC